MLGFDRLTICKIKICVYYMTSVNTPGVSINPFEDTITPAYIKSLIELRPRFLRYPEGEISQNIWWAVSPTWQPATVRFINKNVWPATEKQYCKPNGAPKMFNLRQFLNLCSIVGSIPVILVPMNSMYGVDKTPYSAVSTNAQQLVKYIGKRNVIYELGNETTLGKSPNGNTDIKTYARDATKLIADMKKVNPNVRCLVNGENTAEWSHVSQIPGTVGVVVHNYPGVDFDTWLKHGGQTLAKKVADCKLAIGKKDVYLTETNPTNFTEQPNNVGFGLMNIDILLHSMVSAPKCSIMWTTRWNYAVTNRASLYNMLDPQNRLTCIAHMVKLLSFAMYSAAPLVGGKPRYTNVIMKNNKSVFTFMDRKSGKTSTVVIHKKSTPITISVAAGKKHCTLHGDMYDSVPQYKEDVSTGKVVFPPMSLNIII